MRFLTWVAWFKILTWGEPKFWHGVLLLKQVFNIYTKKRKKTEVVIRKCSMKTAVPQFQK